MMKRFLTWRKLTRSATIVIGCITALLCAVSVSLGYWTATSSEANVALPTSTSTTETDQSTAVLFQATQLGATCDASKVVSPEACAKCHTQEARVWSATPHALNYENLQRNPVAKQIASRMGIRSVKRSDLCSQCHFTRQDTGSGARVVAGVSCESCHGAGKDWITVHNDFGGPGVSRQQESAAHETQRIEKSISLGMRNPRNVYSIARSCLNCHTVPHEQLVNQGGHAAGSQTFELVAWSQGKVRHNFVRTGGQFNQPSDLNRLRIMFVAGIIADMEFSVRAVSQATQRGRFGIESAKRAATKAVLLKRIQDSIQNEQVQLALLAFAEADLSTNNSAQLNAIADRIKQAGFDFADKVDGTTLAVVDSLLPAADQYR